MRIKICSWLKFCTLVLASHRMQLFRVAETDGRDFVFSCPSNSLCRGLVWLFLLGSSLRLSNHDRFVCVCVGLMVWKLNELPFYLRVVFWNPKWLVVFLMISVRYSKVDNLLLSNLRYRHWTGPPRGGPPCSAVPYTESGIGTSCK